MSKLQINQLFKTILIFVVGLICGTILFSEQNTKFDVFLSSNNLLNKSNNNQIEEVLVSLSENFPQNCSSVDQSNDLLNISGLKLNETGFGFNIVPNIVHYVLFNVTEIQFGHFISFLSVLKNQKPEKVYIHCDCSQLSGDYYQRVQRVANKTNTPIIVRTIERPTQIFGRNVSKKWLNWHSADFTRIQVLREFGGIYLDRDVYVVQSLNTFLKYEMTLDWEDDQPMSSGVLIGHKNSRFLKLYYESYHDYREDLWFYNGGELPTDNILKKDPGLVHRVKGDFGCNGIRICPLLFNTYYRKWSQDFYAIHLFIRGNEVKVKDWCFRRKIPSTAVTQFDENNLNNLNVTFAEMARAILLFELQI